MSYVIVVNGSLYNTERGTNFFSRQELDVVFDHLSGGEVMLDADDEVLTVDDLIGDEPEDVYNDNMVEMGDDFVSVVIVELST